MSALSHRGSTRAIAQSKQDCPVRENLGWGYAKIRDALRGIKIEIGRSTVAKILADAGIDRAPERIHNRTWKQFLRSHWETLYACDFFAVETVGMFGTVFPRVYGALSGRAGPSRAGRTVDRAKRSILKRQLHHGCNSMSLTSWRIAELLPRRSGMMDSDEFRDTTAPRLWAKRRRSETDNTANAAHESGRNSVNVGTDQLEPHEFHTEHGG
jgi:hypothetical protein